MDLSSDLSIGLSVSLFRLFICLSVYVSIYKCIYVCGSACPYVCTHAWMYACLSVSRSVCMYHLSVCVCLSVCLSCSSHRQTKRTRRPQNAASMQRFHSRWQQIIFRPVNTATTALRVYLGGLSRKRHFFISQQIWMVFARQVNPEVLAPLQTKRLLTMFRHTNGMRVYAWVPIHLGVISSRCVSPRGACVEASAQPSMQPLSTRVPDDACSGGSGL